jgi:hypothetical protein
MHAESGASGRSSPRREGNALTRAAGRLRSLIGGGSARLESFTRELEESFQPALVITHPLAGRWFAMLETLEPEDNQVGAVLRLSRHAPPEPRKPVRGTAENEERDRELFARPVPGARSSDDDVVLAYSFPLLLSAPRNVQLFREFATNELGRLCVMDSGPAWVEGARAVGA